MKILTVVEDDTDMRQLINVVLSADGRLNIAETASTAEEAIRLAEQLQPDLIILDHFIHGPVTGMEAAPQLKAVAAKVKILLFTSHDLRVEASREPAIDEFLKKSHLPDLLITVQRMLDVHPATPA